MSQAINKIRITSHPHPLLLKQMDCLGQLFSPNISQFKTTVLAMGMDILILTMVKHYYLIINGILMDIMVW